jgi:hypothetical protein
MVWKLLKTQKVLIADGGVSAVEKALKGLCPYWLPVSKSDRPLKNSQSEALRFHHYAKRASQRTYAQSSLYHHFIMYCIQSTQVVSTDELVHYRDA